MHRIVLLKTAEEKNTFKAWAYKSLLMRGQEYSGGTQASTKQQQKCRKSQIVL